MTCELFHKVKFTTGKQISISLAHASIEYSYLSNKQSTPYVDGCINIKVESYRVRSISEFVYLLKSIFKSTSLSIAVESV